MYTWINQKAVCKLTEITQSLSTTLVAKVCKHPSQEASLAGELLSTMGKKSQCILMRP